MTAPDAISVTVPPEHTDGEVAVNEIPGTGWTTMFKLAEMVFVQPVSVFVPYAEKVVVAVGLKGTPLAAPPVHVKVSAPDAVSTTVPPGHTEFEEADATTIGSGFTMSVWLAVLLQPERVFVPVTEKTVETVGVNGTPLLIPPDHV